MSAIADALGLRLLNVPSIEVCAGHPQSQEHSSRSGAVRQRLKSTQN